MKHVLPIAKALGLSAEEVLTRKVNATETREGRPKADVCEIAIADQFVVPDQILTENEAVAFTRLSRSHLAQMRMKRRGPTHVKLGRRILYRRRDLEGWIADNLIHEQ
jgi:predicted DNA-binding transcriptional regulator AlpA